MLKILCRVLLKKLLRVFLKALLQGKQLTNKYRKALAQLNSNIIQLWPKTNS